MCATQEYALKSCGYLSYKLGSGYAVFFSLRVVTHKFGSGWPHKIALCAGLLLKSKHSSVHLEYIRAASEVLQKVEHMLQRRLSDENKTVLKQDFYSRHAKYQEADRAN